MASTLTELARGAMALKLHGELDATIMKMGWQSILKVFDVHSQLDQACLQEPINNSPVPFLNIAAIQS